VVVVALDWWPFYDVRCL